jgi:hypothetical protein
LLNSPFNEQGVLFSPDGRFIAFESDESGRPEVYVAPFPATGGRTRVSTGGARLPHWSRDGRELFYLSDDRRLFAVPVRTAPAQVLGAPLPLFTLNESSTWIDFDVSLDGKRFLAIVPEVVANEQPLTVVSNWTAEIGH